MFCLSFHKIWVYFTYLSHNCCLFREALFSDHLFCELFRIQQLQSHCIPTLSDPRNQAICQHALTNKLTTFSFLFTVILLTLSSQFCFVTAVTMSVFALQQVQFTHVALMNWY